MSARVYYRTSAGDTIEITDLVNRVGWEVKESAEEGATPISTLLIDDPYMAQEFDGHRALMILEDESEITDDVLFGGWTWSQTIGRAQSERKAPLARVWSVEVTDRNAFWQRRVMVGSDCKRPEETDVQRMAWLLSTSEASIFDDVTTYVTSTGGTNMDAVDYRGQYLGQVVDDCAQASGRNFYAWLEYNGVGREMIAWYGRDSLTTRTSDLALTNDPTDMPRSMLDDGTSTTWPISEDTVLRRDPSRVYSGVYLAYDGGAVYRRDNATAAAFAHRDFVAPSSNVKSQAKAAARATRYLNELDTQDDRITTAVELPKGKATMIRAGMRIPFKATHLPGYETYQWLRVLSCTISPISSGEWYRLTLELAPNGNGTWTPPEPPRATAGGVLWGPDDALAAGETLDRIVDWRASGDVHGPGYVDEPLDTTAFAYHTTTGYQDGFEVVCATGILDLRCVFNSVWAHTEAPDVTFTASIRVNGTVVASQEVVVIYDGWGSDVTWFDFTATDVAVVAGDIITVRLATSASIGITIPSGTGENQYLRILNTSTVSG